MGVSHWEWIKENENEVRLLCRVYSISLGNHLEADELFSECVVPNLERAYEAFDPDRVTRKQGTLAEQRFRYMRMQFVYAFRKYADPKRKATRERSYLPIGYDAKLLWS